MIASLFADPNLALAVVGNLFIAAGRSLPPAPHDDKDSDRMRELLALEFTQAELEDLQTFELDRGLPVYGHISFEWLTDLSHGGFAALARYRLGVTLCQERLLMGEWVL